MYIGLVVTPEGLPVAYEVFAGNRADVTTVEAMVELLEKKNGQAQRVWVMDRGMVSEANLAWLRERGALYLVGTTKSQLRQLEKPLLEETDWHAVREGLEVKLVAGPEGTSAEWYVLCWSQDCGAKERAMLERQITRLREEWAKMEMSLQKETVSEAGPVKRRIGKWLGHYLAAAKLFTVSLRRDERGRVCGLAVRERKEKLEWVRQAHGAYLLRTNYTAEDPSALWRVLEQWMASKGLGTCARQLLKELDELDSMDVVLPTDSGVELRLQVVVQAEKELAQLPAHLGLGLPQRH